MAQCLPHVGPGVHNQETCTDSWTMAYLAAFAPAAWWWPALFLIGSQTLNRKNAQTAKTLTPTSYPTTLTKLKV